MIAVTLTDYELAQAAMTGMLRQISAIKIGYNQDKMKPAGGFWQRHIEGACGEVAVAKAMGRYWGGSVNTFKTIGDLDSTGWEVRTRSDHDYDLIIRDDDDDERVFILVTGSAPEYLVRGWIKAADAKRGEWRKDYGGHGAAYFVPPECLREMGDLR